MTQRPSPPWVGSSRRPRAPPDAEQPGYLALQQAGWQLVGSGAAPYRVLGRITVGTPYGRLSFPYDRVGRFATLPGR